MKESNLFTVFPKQSGVLKIQILVKDLEPDIVRVEVVERRVGLVLELTRE